MTTFQRTSQATHPIEGLERPVCFTSFPEHTLLESGKLPIAEIAELALREGQCTNSIYDSNAPADFTGNRLRLLASFGT